MRYLVLPYLSLHITIEHVISQATNMATSSHSLATNMATSSHSQATSPEMLYCLLQLVSLSDGESVVSV